MAFLKKHYEKVILGVLLAVFIILLAIQIVLVGNLKKTDDDKRISYNKKAAYTNQVEVRSGISAVKTLEDFRKWAPKKTGIDAEKKFVDFILPYPMTICPECHKAIPKKDFEGTEVNGIRIYRCSIGNHDLTPPAVRIVAKQEDMTDTDKDGIPDAYEKRLSGFNPNDANDAKLDFDSDFFTNKEEYDCKTDPLNAFVTPRNPKANKKDPAGFIGRLPFYLLVKVLKVERKKYSFVYTGTSNNKLSFNVKRLNARGREVVKYVRLAKGEEFASLNERMKVIDGNSTSAKVRDMVTGEEFTVKRNDRDVKSAIVEATLATRTRKTNIKVKIKDTFTLGNIGTGEEKYTVVAMDQNSQQVTVKRDNAPGNIVLTTKSYEDNIREYAAKTAENNGTGAAAKAAPATKK